MMFLPYLLLELYTHTMPSYISYFSFIGACLLTLCKIMPQRSFDCSCFLISVVINNFLLLWDILTQRALGTSNP